MKSTPAPTHAESDGHGPDAPCLFVVLLKSGNHYRITLPKKRIEAALQTASEIISNPTTPDGKPQFFYLIRGGTGISSQAAIPGPNIEAVYWLYAHEDVKLMAEETIREQREFMKNMNREARAEAKYKIDESEEE